MLREELKHYEITLENPFWVFLGHAWKGNSMIALAERAGWVAVPIWGKGGYDLGSWPFSIVFLKEQPEPDGSYLVCVHVDGDPNSVYQAPTKEIRNTIVDTIAFSLWQWEERPWTKGVVDPEQVSEECKGPFLSKWAA